MHPKLTGREPAPHATCDTNLREFGTTDAVRQAPNARSEQPVWLSGLPALSQRMERLLIEGDVDGTYAILTKKRRDKSSRDGHGHRVTSALATAAARAGWTERQFQDVLLESTSKGGNHAKNKAHHKGHEFASTYVTRVFSRAAQQVARFCISDRKDALADLLALRERIGQMGWRGTARNTAMRLLMAHWRAAYRSGGRTYTLSYREAAEQAGCTVFTAWKATQHQLARWLRPLKSDTSEHGSKWRLLDGGGQDGPGGDLDTTLVEALMSLDAFAYRGLGSSSLKILAALSVEDGQDRKGLEVSASMSRATVYRHLGRLADFGLVDQVDDCWFLTERAQEALSAAWEGWQGIAEDLGTDGVSERRSALHRAQRKAWLECTLPKLRERRMPDVQPVRGDEIDPRLVRDGGRVIDPVTGEVLECWRVASDGRLILVDEEPDPSPEPLLSLVAA